MASRTEETIDKLSKKNIISIVLSLQSELACSNAKVLEEVRKLNDKFVQLESQLLLTQNVNTLLQKRVIDAERQCWENAQYTRRECLEISGIPTTVEQSNLEDKVLSIFEKIGCNVAKENIEACHRVGKHKNVIVKFSKRSGNKVFQLKKILLN